MNTTDGLLNLPPLRALLGWTRNPFGKLTLLILALLVFATGGFWFFEHYPKGTIHDTFGALWWAVVTLTTVGYGDVVPITTGGKVMGLVVMFCGIGLVSTLTGNLASMLVEHKARKRKGLLKVHLTNHVIIVGWNDFGLELISALRENGVLRTRDGQSDLVLVNGLTTDERETLALQINLEERLHFVWGAVTQESVLLKAQPDKARVIYLLSQERGREAKDADQETLYAALALRELAPQTPIYGEVALPENRKHLLRAGVNEILVHGQLTSLVLGLLGASPSMWTLVQELLGMRGGNLLDIQPLSGEERKLTWGELHPRFRADGRLPMALCKAGHQISLKDVLDQGSALDQFILELFESSGQETRLGDTGPRVLTNPPDSEPLEPFDAVLYLKPGGGAMNLNDIDWGAISLFKDLPAQALDKVRAIFELRSIGPGENLITEGEEGDEMFILVEGRVRISKSMLIEGMSLPILDVDNPRKVLATLDQADYPLFGEIALMDREKRSATVQALTEVSFLATDRHRFFELLDAEPAIGVKLSRRLARRMAATIRKNNHELVKLSTALALALSRYKAL